jgi:N-hydroxyarylamine O-acetyltransferase
MTTPSIDGYLDRIGYTGERTPTLETLRALHLAHLEAVPFENLDIAWGHPLSLELPALYDKIVGRRRGGFCYELNGLFAWLLRELGFDVTYLSASDVHEDGSYGLEFDHLTLQVCCPGEPADNPGYLADVGWGDSFCLPLRLGTADEQPEGDRTFWLEPQTDGGSILWMRDHDGRTERQYHFTFQPRAYTDFGPMCLYHQTSPQSSFTQQRLCTRATPTGRLTLRNDRFVVTEHNNRTVRGIDDAEYAALLREHFGIAQ